MAATLPRTISQSPQLLLGAGLLQHLQPLRLRPFAQQAGGLGLHPLGPQHGLESLSGRAVVQGLADPGSPRGHRAGLPALPQQDAACSERGRQVEPAQMEPLGSLEVI